MNEIFAVFFATVLGLIVVASAQRFFRRREQQVIWLAFFAHVAGTFAQVFITKYVLGGGDMFMYFRHGMRLAEYLSGDPGFYGPRVVQLILQDKNVILPFHVPAVGSSTGTVVGVTGVLAFVTGGSIYATCIVLATWALTGQIAIYRVMREVFPRQLHDRMMVACFLLPSVIFWTSGILKETLALGGLGWLLLGLQRLIFTRNTLSGIFFGFVGGTVVLLTKVYILFALVAAVGVWFYWHRTLTASKRNALISQPLYIAAAMIAAIVAMTYLGELFPKYSLDQVQEETARLQQTYYRIEGGSTYALGGSTETSADQQAALAPLAFFTALFRPFIFEAHNAPAFVNSLETLALLWLLVLGLRRRGLKPTVALIARSPFAMFCVVFVMVFGTAVGLGAPNLGSLSRYRVPMMPFYVALILLILPLRRPLVRRPAEALTVEARTK